MQAWRFDYGVNGTSYNPIIVSYCIVYPPYMKYQVKQRRVMYIGETGQRLVDLFRKHLRDAEIINK